MGGRDVAAIRRGRIHERWPPRSRAPRRPFWTTARAGYARHAEVGWRCLYVDAYPVVIAKDIESIRTQVNRRIHPVRPVVRSAYHSHSSERVSNVIKSREGRFRFPGLRQATGWREFALPLCGLLRFAGIGIQFTQRFVCSLRSIEARAAVLLQYRG